MNQFIEIMRFLNKQHIETVIIILMIGFISVNSVIIFYSNIPPIELINKSDQEKMQYYLPDYVSVVDFIEINAEKGTNILIFHYDYYILCKPLLYPDYNCFCTQYVNDTVTYMYLKSYQINYIMILNDPFSFSSNSTIFTKIYMNSTYFLLQVNATYL